MILTMRITRKSLSILSVFLRPVYTHNSSTAFVSSQGTARLISTTASRKSISENAHDMELEIDELYPGTAVQRMKNVHLRVQELFKNKSLNGPWDEVRRNILWAGGLKDLPNAIPGQGYTGHSFNDFNHVDLTCMNDEVSDNQNRGQVKGIAYGNKLGEGIRIASIEDLGPGGSWSTCAMGCNKDPPQDVAHLQFRARIAFKLVWVPDGDFDTFVLVDDEGKLLAQGRPTSSNGLPALRERQLNYRLVEGSKYALEADKLATQTK